MPNYRITKYNPLKRNEQGHYLDDSEWTAISDINVAKYNHITFEEYEKVESTYIDAIKLIMKDENIAFLKVDSVELRNTKQDFKKFEKTIRLKNIAIDFDKEIKKLKNGLQLDITELDKIIRLILREMVWMILVNNYFEVRFGFDYYMYVKTSNIKQSTIEKIQNMGLFVESLVE